MSYDWRRASHGSVGRSAADPIHVGVGKRTLTMDLPTAPASPEALGPVRVIASALRIRREPTTANHANICGRLPHGAVVTPLGRDGDWLRIEHHGVAFIHGGYVVPVAGAAHPAAAAHATPSPAPSSEDDGNAAGEHERPHDAAPVEPPAPPSADAPTTQAPTTQAPTTQAPTTQAPTTQAPAQEPQAPTMQGPAQEPQVPSREPQAPAPQAAPAPQPAPGAAKLLGSYSGMFSKVYDTGSQKVQVFVSPGGLSPTPNIYLHFHGHYADYGIDGDLAWDAKSGSRDPKERPAPHRSGIDQAKEAMKSAQDRNTIAILPQGVLGQGTQVKGDYSHEGGYMEDLDRLGLPAFLTKILGPLAKDLGITGGLTPGNIGIGGHSAGGYMGAHTALSKAGALADSITDLTFFDASYSSAHLEDAKHWMLKGKGGKNLRIVNSWSQQSEHSFHPEWREAWFRRFGPPALEQLARSKGMTVRQLAVGEKFDAATTVMQHSQVINKDGAVQCDVLVTMTSLPGGHDHDPLRDRYIDDAMLSVGEGVHGNEEFGHYQRGKLAPQTAAHGAAHDQAAPNDPGPQPQHQPEAAVAKPGDTVDPSIHTLPQAEHAEDTKGPEPVKPPPKAPEHPAKAKHAHLVEGDYATVKAGLYGDDGIISRNKLHRQSFVKVKGKKEKVEVNLTDEQFDFKQRVYDAAIKTLGKKLYGGVNDRDLAPIGHGQRIRKEVVGPLEGMLRAMKAGLPAGHDVWVGSGYRDPVEDFSIWDDKFNEIYLWATKAEREKRWPDKPYGPDAVQYTVEQIAPRKAPPGGSNHSNGIAVDLHISIDGKDVPVSFGNQKAYKATPQYAWLEDHAHEHNFKNWYKEAWHYDYKP